MMIHQQKELNEKQKRFCKEFVANGYNVTQAAISAGYSEKTAAQIGSRLLRQVKIKDEIGRLQAKIEKKSIATAQEVMEYFTQVMKGEIKDQFGLEAPLSERTRAAQELAKRTIDIENRLKGQPDAKVEIVLDWNMDNT